MWSKGKDLVTKFKRFLLVLVALLEEIDRLHSCLYFSASGHHDEVDILSSGTPTYVRRTRGNFGRTDRYNVAYLVDNIRKGGGK